MPVNGKILAGFSLKKEKSKPESFRLIGDFKTGKNVTVPRKTVGTVIADWKLPTPRCCVRLAISCPPGVIVITRTLVEPVRYNGGV